MKKLLLIAVIGLLSYSCTSKWEYKTVSVKGEEQETMGKFKTNTFDVSDESLNLFGNEGWELVGIYEKLKQHTQILATKNMFQVFNQM